MIFFCLYALLLLGIGLRDARRGGTPAAFFVNNRASGRVHVGISIVASCVGGSATIGMAGLAWETGTPAFWWLGSGACGLIVLTVFLARKIRETGAYTMPEMVVLYLGPSARPLVSLIIVLAWLAILAAQFTAMGKLTATLTGQEPSLAMPAGAAVIVIYALLGGQASVIRSDFPQFLLLAAGLLLTLAYLVGINPQPLQTVRLEGLNAGFSADRLSYYLLVLGGSYVVCPMLFGRFLSARNSREAVHGGWIGIVGLVLTALVIVMLGISCRGLLPAATATDDVLTTIMGHVPSWLGLFLLLALLSAVLSSADSCLITASTVCCHDLLGRNQVGLCRIVTLFLGAGGFIMAAQGKSILHLLLMANDIYVCGVVAPVFIGMLAHGKASILPGWANASVVLGGVFGLGAALSGWTALSGMGIALSATLCLCGLRKMEGTYPAMNEMK